MKQFLSILILIFPLWIFSEPFNTIDAEVASLKMSGGKMDVEMINVEGNKWKIKSIIKAGGGIFSRTESASFEINADSIKPLRWSRKERILFSKKNYLVTFDWLNSVISFNEDGNKGKLDLLPNYLGPATGPLLLRLKLRKSGLDNLPEKIELDVYFKGEIKHRNFSIKGLETVNTSLGTFQAIKVVRVRSEADPREQEFWFAPDLDFALIKVINDDGQEKRELMISSYEDIGS
ncbi:MAG: DUF3108 domain-containing protein [SAR86 cluster bacterium]|nr:DUF3108 domain-containing protein [SAR86 cluster bacterium]